MDEKNLSRYAALAALMTGVLSTASALFGFRANVAFWIFAGSAGCIATAALLVWPNVILSPTPKFSSWQWRVTRYCGAFLLLGIGLVLFAFSLDEQPARAPTAELVTSTHPEVANDGRSALRSATPERAPSTNPQSVRTPPTRVRFAKDGEEFYPASIADVAPLIGRWCPGGQDTGSIEFRIRDGILEFKSSPGAEFTSSDVFISQSANSTVFYLIYDGIFGESFFELSSNEEYLTQDLRTMNGGDSDKGYTYGMERCR